MLATPQTCSATPALMSHGNWLRMISCAKRCCDSTCSNPLHCMVLKTVLNLSSEVPGLGVSELAAGPKHQGPARCCTWLLSPDPRPDAFFRQPGRP